MGRPSKAMVTVAGAALLLAGGGAYALASSGGGNTITVCVKHKGGALYKAKRCAKHDKKLSWSKQGPPGPRGTAGSRGQQGIQGPQGPGGSVLTYDANASATPAMTTIGSVLGDTFSAKCALVSGHVETDLFIRTSDGSLKMDWDNSPSSGSVSVGRFNIAAGTLTTPSEIDAANSTTGDTQLQATQIGPSPGVMTWHLTADDTGQTCHGSIMSFPTTLTSVAGSPAAASKPLHSPLASLTR